jgi:flagellar biosynthesis GTPase FlhF
VPAAVPKAQFVSVEAALRFIGQVCQANPDSDKKEASALANLNRCGVEMSKERGTAVIKIAEKAGLFVGDCGNTALKAAREKYDADCKEKRDAAKEKEKQEKLAAKEKEKQAKVAEKEKEKAAKRKIDEVEAASAEPVAAPKAKRVRKEKAAPKAREALGLDADQVIGTQIDQEWGMAE